MESVFHLFELLHATGGKSDDESEFQYTYVPSVAVLENGRVSRRKYESYGSRRGNQKAVCRVTVRFSGEESAFSSGVGIQR